MRDYSPSRLAYLGDTVYELCVRERLVRLNVRRPSLDALRYVTAKEQCRAARIIRPLLTGEEDDIFRRGTNVGHANIPKSATLAEYRTATGLECLFGWLRLEGREDRIRALFDAAFPPESPEAGDSLPEAHDPPDGDA